MFDYTFILKDSGSVSSSGYGTVDSEAAVINVGSGLVTFNLVFLIDSIKCSAGNELYTLHLMGGDDSSFTKTVSLCSKEFGAAASLQGSLDSKISKIVFHASNEERGVTLPLSPDQARQFLAQIHQ